MVHKDGVRSEDFIEDWLREEMPEKEINRVHQPFDFLIDTKFLEVKSAKLYTKKSNGKIVYQHGRYECWNKKQLAKLKKRNIWICFVIQHDGSFIIHGFAMSKDIPNKRVMSMHSIQHIPLKSKRQWLAYMRDKDGKRMVAKEIRSREKETSIKEKEKEIAL